MLIAAFLFLLLEEGIKNHQYIRTFVAYHLERLSSAHECN